MQKEIIVNVSPNEVRVGLMEDRQLVEVAMERADSKRVVGNVYKGIVSAVRPGLQAAFVDIGMEKAGFLHVSDLIHDDSKEDDGGGPGGRRSGRRGRGRENMRSIETMLREGDNILVQVTKEVIGTKGPRLTADISLPGRFLVMMPMGSHVGVSRKIEDRGERSRLRDLLARLKPTGPGAYIIRTAGSGINEKMLERDMEYLAGLWTEVGEKAKVRPAPSLVHEDVGMIVGLVRDIFKEDVDALHLDDKAEHERLMNYLKTFAPEMKNRVHLYKGATPIFDKFGIENEIKKSLDKKVWLNRGGFLVIEQTEALISIDVNTGRYTGKKNQDETILRTNMLAAREVPRQLRLRDIGGIIVIDFIDMESEADKRRVFNELRTYLRNDRARHKTFQISDLGLVEMSRQRVRESLRDQLSDDCIFCRGSGKVLSIETMGNKVERLLEKVPLVSRDSAMQVQASPTLALVLQTDRAENIRQIARQNGLKISVVDDPRLHREEFKIIALESRQDLVAMLEEGGRSDGRDGRRGRVDAESARSTASPDEGGRAPRRESSRREASRRGGRGRGGRLERGDAEGPSRREARPSTSAPREERERPAPSTRRPAPSAVSAPVTPIAPTAIASPRPSERTSEPTGEQPRRRRRRRGRRGRGGSGAQESSDIARESKAMRQPDPNGSTNEAGQGMAAEPSSPGAGEMRAPREESQGERSRGGRRRGSRGRGSSRGRGGERNDEAQVESPREREAARSEEPPASPPVAPQASDLSTERKPPERRPRRRVRRNGASGGGSSDAASKERGAPAPGREAPSSAPPQQAPTPAPVPAAQAPPVETLQKIKPSGASAEGGTHSAEGRPRGRRRNRRTRRATPPSGSKGDDSSQPEPAAAAVLVAEAADAES
jgi:ribonuclease G